GGLIMASIIDEGIAVVTTKFEVYFNFSLKKKKLYPLAFAGLVFPPVALCAFPLPQNSSTGETSLSTNSHLNASPSSHSDIALLIACENGKLLLLTSSTVQDMEINGESVMEFAISRSKKYISCLTTHGVLYIYSKMDLTKPIEVATFDHRKIPKQIEWCGDDCVAIYLAIQSPSEELKHMLFLGGPKSEWLPYQFSNGIFLVAEIDGLRIISAYKSEILQRVPSYTEAIFGIGSCESPAMLCYAMERFEFGDISVDESLRAIKSELREAVEACVHAAAFEWSIDTIRGLLKAAVFGRHFLDVSTSFNLLIEKCRNIRICLAVRAPPLFMILTEAQLVALSIESLVIHISQYVFYI
ncbi:putative vacuolar protein sorting 16, partial [Cardiosporidium cionae]